MSYKKKSRKTSKNSVSFRPRKEFKSEPEILTTAYTYGKTVFNEGESEFVTISELPAEQQELKVHVFPPNVEVARATVGRTYKVNVGNYESVDMFVSVSLPCFAEEVQETIERAKQVVINEARNQAISVKNQVKKVKNGKE